MINSQEDNRDRSNKIPDAINTRTIETSINIVSVELIATVMGEKSRSEESCGDDAFADDCAVIKLNRVIERKLVCGGDCDDDDCSAKSTEATVITEAICGSFQRNNSAYGDGLLIENGDSCNGSIVQSFASKAGISSDTKDDDCEIKSLGVTFGNYENNSEIEAELGDR